jgi:hypothetical protein
MNMTEQKLSLIFKEIDVIEGRISTIEEKRIGIKNWCIVTWVAALGFAIESEQPLILLTAFIPVIFFLLEILSERHQDAYGKRIEIIRSFLNEHLKSGYVSDFEFFKMRGRLSQKKPWRQLCHYARKSRSNRFLYGSLVAGSVFLWFVLLFGPELGRPENGGIPPVLAYPGGVRGGIGSSGGRRMYAPRAR